MLKSLLSVQFTNIIGIVIKQIVVLIINRLSTAIDRKKFSFKKQTEPGWSGSDDENCPVH